jgi:hypothetical protein
MQPLEPLQKAALARGVGEPRPNFIASLSQNAMMDKRLRGLTATRSMA